MVEDPNYWMRRALELAKEATLIDEVPIGAILLRNGEILGQGYNLRETSHRTMAHAEMIALENFNFQYSTWRLPPGTCLFVTAEPCLMCVGALLNARLDYLYYGCQDPKNAGTRLVSHYIESGTFDHRFVKVTGGVQGEECGRVLSTYFRNKRLEQI